MNTCKPTNITQNNGNCCNSDTALRDQLRRLFGLPDADNCNSLYYLTYNCDTLGNQSLEQLVTTLVNNSIAINITPITITSGANINDPLYNGIKVTQAGSNYILQLNTFGLNAGTAYTGAGGLSVSGTTVVLGGTPLAQGVDTIIQGSSGTNLTGMFWGSNAFPITTFGITTKCLKLEVKDRDDFSNPIPLVDGEYVLSMTALNGCAEWHQFTSASSMTFTNGLVRTGNTVRMGGTFNQPATSIDGLTTASFELTNMNQTRFNTTTLNLRIGGTYGAPGQALIGDGLGNVTYQTIPVSPPLVYSGSNGINVVGTVIKQGGTLVDALTVINGTTTKNFRYQDINSFELITTTASFSVAGSTGTSGQVPTANGAGQWTWTSIALVTAENGLKIVSPNNVALGGTMNTPTTLLGIGQAFQFLNMGLFRIESKDIITPTLSRLRLTLGSTDGANGMLLASDGTYASWRTLPLPYIVTASDPYTVLPEDGNIIITTADSSVALPPVIDQKILVVTVKNAGAANQIVPFAGDEIHDGTTVYTFGIPYVIAANGIVWLQGIVDAIGTDYWQIVSKS